MNLLPSPGCSLAQLGSLAQHIEHIGSTAVPGLAAKPIIDIDVVIENDALLPAVITSLAELGYTHAGDQGIPGRQAFKRQGEYVPFVPGALHPWIDHHLYVCRAEQCRARPAYRLP